MQRKNVTDQPQEAFLPIAGFARLKKFIASFENAKRFQKSLLRSLLAPEGSDSNAPAW
jgi:hypothetical protein